MNKLRKKYNHAKKRKRYLAAKRSSDKMKRTAGNIPDHARRFPANFHCLGCGSIAIPQRMLGAQFMPNNPGTAKILFAVCHCGAYVACHPFTEIPMGYPADHRTRAARRALHKKMDPLWNNLKGRRKAMVRASMYEMVAEKMRIKPEMAHTGLFTTKQCARAWHHLKNVTAAELFEYSRRK